MFAARDLAAAHSPSKNRLPPHTSTGSVRTPSPRQAHSSPSDPRAAQDTSRRPGTSQGYERSTTGSEIAAETQNFRMSVRYSRRRSSSSLLGASSSPTPTSIGDQP